MVHSYLKHAVEMLQTTSGLSEREAETYVRRVFDGQSRGEAASEMGISENTVDNHLQNARRKRPKLPPITRVSSDRQKEDGITTYRTRLHFETGGIIQFTHESEGDEAWSAEQTIRATEESVHDSLSISLESDELKEAAFNMMEEYAYYIDKPEELRNDWPHVWEAITLMRP